MRLREIISALTFDNQALERLYAIRRALRPSEENRTRLTVGICATLFLLIMAFLMTMAWSRKDADSYLATRSNILYLQDSDSTWMTGDFAAKNCASGFNCYASLLQQRSSMHAADLLSVRSVGQNSTTNPGSLQLGMLRAMIQPRSWKALTSNKTLLLSMPAFSYRRADVYIAGQLTGTFFDSTWITYQFQPDRFRDLPVNIDVVLEIDTDQSSLVSRRFSELPKVRQFTSVMTMGEYNDYQQFIASESAGRGDFIGAIARITMAVFVLALFLIIDGSPETLGLGLFMGFEAFAISTAFGWLPVNQETLNIIRHYCYQMGDIFRLFFFLQLARVIHKGTGPWLLWGSILSLPYGVLRAYSSVWDITWQNEIPNVRDLTIGLLGVIVCVRAAWFLRNKKLPWRVLALALAAIASLEQTLDPLVHYTPWLAQFDILRASINAMQPLSAWLLAFSAFINISTLENRVKVLSTIEAKAKEIQREMELGKAVQDAFLHLPKMPAHLQMACHHEAMLYVSGDTYFVDWNEQHQRLTFLINDATGHGVQAALKASGVNVIANTVWSHRGDDAWTEGKMARYCSLVHDFFSRMNENPDVIAMGGCEFDVRTGKLTFYRMNFPFPIIIEPKHFHIDGEDSRRDDLWRIDLLPIPNQQFTTIQLEPGSFTILTSDGFLDTSRRTSDFLRLLRKNLGKASHDLDADRIKALFLESDIFEENAARDDRTMVVFQWRPSADTGEKSPPHLVPNDGAA